MKVLMFNSNAWFTFSSRVLVETFGEMWTRWSMHKCRHSHSHARIMRQFETFSFPLTWDWFPVMSPRASGWDENRFRVWKTRLMYPSHSCSRLVLCCLDENVNQALLIKVLNHESQSLLNYIIMQKSEVWHFSTPTHFQNW